MNKPVTLPFLSQGGGRPRTVMSYMRTFRSLIVKLKKDAYI